MNLGKNAHCFPGYIKCRDNDHLLSWEKVYLPKDIGDLVKNR